MGKKSCKKGSYYCNTDKKCKPIPDGYKMREDGFLVKEGWSDKYKKSIDCDNPKGFSQKAHCAGKKKKSLGEASNPRIPRKKGQPAKSKKHSDLYTDEDPKGTIHGLGFKNVAIAKASVAKIRKSSRSHAHKIQAAIAMEQRARVMGKTAEAAVYRKFINSMKKKTKAMNEGKSHKGDHEYEMIRRQTDNIMVSAKKIKKRIGDGEGDVKAWVQSKITKAADYLDTAADYMTDKEEVKEGSLHKWFKGSKSKDGKGGWVNVLTGGTCASDEPGEGVPKCVSRAKYERMTPAERRSAARRKKAADPGQQEKRGAAKPTYVSTDKPKKKRKMKKEETEFTSLPLQLEVPQNDGEFKLGLMFRESLEQDRGMLFIFEDTDYHTFHMKNTFIPLDIAFINEEGIIESIKELDPLNPIPVYPDGKIRYAIEVNRGWFAENGVVVGDAILEEGCEQCGESCDDCECECHNTITEVKDRKGKGSGKKDACYHKVKSRYSVWPSAYASGALVKCRKVGAANWGNSRKEEVEYEAKIYKTPHYRWRDALTEHHRKDEDGNTIPHEGDDVQEQYSGNLSPAQIRFKEREKKGLDGLTGNKPGTPQLSGVEKAQKLAKDRIAQGKTIAQVNADNKQSMIDRAKRNNQNSQSGGNTQTTNTNQGGQQAAQKKPGFLQRVKNRLGQVRQGISDTARGAVSLGKRVAGGAVDAATGGLTDLDKKGGRVTGVSRVVGGAIDKLTGDRTDLDRRGATPLNKGQQNQVKTNNQNLPPSQRPGSQKGTLIQKLRDRKNNPNSSSLAGGAIRNALNNSYQPEGQIIEGRRPPMTRERLNQIKKRNAEKTPEQREQDRKTANDFYNSFMKNNKKTETKGVDQQDSYQPEGEIIEGHYGSAVNKIPKELDKAVALHKSQAERLRKSPEFKNDAGEIANKIPGQLDKAVAMHTKQAKQLRAAGVGEKNCGCGQTPCKTYGKKKKKLNAHYNWRVELEEKKGQKCWPGYEKKGTKKMFGKTYNNCVKKK